MKTADSATTVYALENIPRVGEMNPVAIAFYDTFGHIVGIALLQLTVVLFFVLFAQVVKHLYADVAYRQTIVNAIYMTAIGVFILVVASNVSVIFYSTPLLESFGIIYRAIPI